MIRITVNWNLSSIYYRLKNVGHTYISTLYRIFLSLLVLSIWLQRLTLQSSLLSNCLYSQQGLDNLNLLQLGIKRSYNIIHNALIIGCIVGILTLVLCLIIMMKYSNATSKSKLSSPTIESMWLVLPAIILISLSTPALLSLYHRDRQNLYNGASLKTTGLQWYWSYEFADKFRSSEDNSISSYIDNSSNDRLTYLSRESELHLPRNVEIVNIVSASDVIHCWTIPNIILKVDAIPGRVNIVSIIFEEMSGLVKLYGQCSELCGVNHRFMPISVLVT